MSKQKTATLNEKVTVNRDFSLVVPEGYLYSTDKSDINENRLFVFIKTEQNEFFNDNFGDFAEFSLAEPFGAPQCLTVMEAQNLAQRFGGDLDLSNDDVREAMKGFATQFLTMFGGECITVKVVYQCNHKFSGEKKCTTPTFEEEQIKSMFVIAVNRLIENKAEIIRNYEEMRDLIFDTSALETERDSLNEELTVVAELIQKVVDENARTAQSQDKYREKYDSLVARFEKAKERIAEIARLKSDKESRRLQSDSFMKELKKLDSLVTEFDEKLWYTLVDRIMVYSKEDICFVFRDGAEIKI